MIFLFGLFLALVMNFRYMVHSAEGGVAVVVYFDEGAKQEQIDDIGAKIRQMTEVDHADYISADQAWEEFRDDYLGGDENLAEGFRDQDNPLANSASYQVYLKNVEDQDKVVAEIEKMDGVRDVSQSQSAAKTLSTCNKLIGYVSLAIVFILLAVAFFLISNTITMGISVRQEEIGIMKLIGATDFFVRAPFVIEGIILGTIGAAIPLGVLYGLYNQVIKYVMTKFHLLTGFLQFLDAWHVFRILIPVGVGLGIGIGFIGSMISVRKHLRV